MSGLPFSGGQDAAGEQHEQKLAESPPATANAPQFTCPVCLELMVEPLTLACGHSLCAWCFEQHTRSYLAREPPGRDFACCGFVGCPQCRAPVPADSGGVSILLREAVRAEDPAAYARRLAEVELLRRTGASPPSQQRVAPRPLVRDLQRLLNQHKQVLKRMRDALEEHHGPHTDAAAPVASPRVRVRLRLSRAEQSDEEDEEEAEEEEADPAASSSAQPAESSLDAEQWGGRSAYETEAERVCALAALQALSAVTDRVVPRAGNFLRFYARLAAQHSDYGVDLQALVLASEAGEERQLVSQIQALSLREALQICDLPVPEAPEAPGAQESAHAEEEEEEREEGRAEFARVLGARLARPLVGPRPFADSDGCAERFLCKFFVAGGLWQKCALQQHMFETERALLPSALHESAQSQWWRDMARCLEQCRTGLYGLTPPQRARRQFTRVLTLLAAPQHALHLWRPEAPEPPLPARADAYPLLRTYFRATDADAEAHWAQPRRKFEAALARYGGTARCADARARRDYLRALCEEPQWTHLAFSNRYTLADRARMLREDVSRLAPLLAFTGLALALTFALIGALWAGRALWPLWALAPSRADAAEAGLALAPLTLMWPRASLLVDVGVVLRRANALATPLQLVCGALYVCGAAWVALRSSWPRALPLLHVLLGLPLALGRALEPGSLGVVEFWCLYALVESALFEWHQPLQPRRTQTERFGGGAAGEGALARLWERLPAVTFKVFAFGLFVLLHHVQPLLCAAAVLYDTLAGCWMRRLGGLLGAYFLRSSAALRLALLERLHARQQGEEAREPLRRWKPLQQLAHAPLRYVCERVGMRAVVVVATSAAAARPSRVFR